jgi:hypothetical protein
MAGDNVSVMRLEQVKESRETDLFQPLDVFLAVPGLLHLRWCVSCRVLSDFSFRFNGKDIFNWMWPEFEPLLKHLYRGNTKITKDMKILNVCDDFLQKVYSGSDNW